MGAHHHDTIIVEEPCGILADIRDVGCKLLHSALGLADLGHELIDVYGSEDVPAHHLL